MAKNEKTSTKVGAIASKAVKAPASVSKKDIKSPAAPALTQSPDKKAAKKK